jgi:hypothetical protein
MIVLINFLIFSSFASLLVVYLVMPPSFVLLKLMLLFITRYVLPTIEEPCLLAWNEFTNAISTNSFAFCCFPSITNTENVLLLDSYSRHTEAPRHHHVSAIIPQLFFVFFSSVQILHFTLCLFRSIFWQSLEQ